MSEFLMELPFSDLVTFGAALFGLSATLLVQCGGNKTAKKKPGQSSKSISKRAGKSAKGGAKKSSRSSKSKKNSAKSKKPARKSSRASSVSEKNAKTARSQVGTAQPKKDKSVSINKSGRSTKTAKEVDVKTAKALSQTKPVETEVRKSEYAPQPIAQPKQVEELSIKSLQEMQKEHGTDIANNSPVALQMEPRVLRFSDQGGLQKVQLHNPTNIRQAVKVKCSDNTIFKVNPVFGYIEPGQHLSVSVLRQNGGSKVDKLVFVTTKASAENTDIKKLFKAASKEEMPLIVLPLIA